MKLKDYGRNPTQRKVYVQQLSILLIGVDVSKANHDACICAKNICLHLQSIIYLVAFTTSFHLQRNIFRK
jgi:hypothetical protein